MSEDWFAVALIKGGSAILYGVSRDGSVVNKMLTAEQSREVERLDARQQAAMQNLLRGFVL